MNAEFTIETAEPTPCRRGRHNHKLALRLAVESLQPGQVLRWRPSRATTRSRGGEVAWLVAREFPGRKFTTRKADLGFDIYRTA